MARRRNRKNEAFSDLTVKAVGVIIGLAIISPAFRKQLGSAVTSAIAVAVLVCVATLLIYLLWYLSKKKNTPKSVGNSFLTPARPVGTPVARAGVAPNVATEGIGFHQVINRTQPEPTAVSLKPAEWTESVLAEIEWKRFEIVTRDFLRMAGYEAHETTTGADGGVDIRVTKPGTEGMGIVQCKAWNTYNVGVKPVRELFGVMAAEKINTGMVITSRNFTREAEEFAKGKVTLVSGANFLQLIKKLPEDKQQRLLDTALDGDYRTPTCPQCDVKMVLRESKNGRNNGGQFWGCIRYPRCKQTLVYKTV